MMRKERGDLPGAFILQVQVQRNCTTSAGLNFWIIVPQKRKMLRFCLGQMHISSFFVGGILGDQHEGEKYTGESCICHRCHTPRNAYLFTDHFTCKTMNMNRTKIEKAAQGINLPLLGDKCIVQWDANGQDVRPGPRAN